jgi:uncharacterized protein (TIGR03437 family)
MKMNPTVMNAWRPSPKTGLWLFTCVLVMSSMLWLNWSAPTASAQQNQVAVINAASFNSDRRVAPDSIAAAFGQFVTTNNQSFSATTLPLPTTLGGVQLRVDGVAAGLFFVGTQQINFVVPPALADSPSATVQVTNADGSTRTGTVTIIRSAAGIFSARANGLGVAAALTTFDGLVYQSVFNPDLSEKDVDPGTSARKNVLVLYTTGLRNVPAANPSDSNGVAESVTVTLQGIPLEILFAGPVAGLAALDQINAYLPPEAAGLGSVDIEVSTRNPNVTDPQRSNKVTIKMGGTIPNVRVLPITPDVAIDGELTIDDQIQQLDDGTKRTFFFDAYRFTTTQANTTVAVDVRTRGNTTLDPAALLYRVNNGQLEFVGEDDQSGGYGNGEVENNNALLLTVLPTPGDYVIFVSSANEQPNGLGTYTVRMRQNVITQVNYGTSLTTAAITTTDIQTSAGTYLDVYWFQAAANDNIDARMGSAVFDSFLILQANEGGPFIATDDNGGGNFDARIQRRLGTPGIYILLATPFAPNRTGTYSFSLNRISSASAELFDYRGPQRTLLNSRESLGGRQAGRTSARTIEP